jgi:hypothetical protein
MGALQTHDPCGSDQLRKRPRKTSGQGRAGLVVTSKPLDGPVPELGSLEVGGQLLEDDTDLVAHRLAVEWGQGGLCGTGRQRSTMDGAIRGNPADLTRLDIVVIVTGNPEDRHHGPLPLPLQNSGHAGGRKRLVDGIERTGKQSRLLAGRHCNGVRLAKARQSRIPRRTRNYGVGQCRIEAAFPGRGEIPERRQRGGYDPQGHATCPSRIVLGVSGPSGEPS